MQWYAVYNTATGELYSTGTVVADEAVLTANGFTAVEISGDPTGQVWDATTHTFSAPPVT